MNLVMGFTGWSWDEGDSSSWKLLSSFQCILYSSLLLGCVAAVWVGGRFVSYDSPAMGCTIKSIHATYCL